MSAILAWLGSFLTGPLLAGALKAYQAKLTNDNNADQRTADLMARELAVEQAEQQVQEQRKVAEIGHGYEPEKLLAYVVVFYFGKIMVWDAALHLGVTDAVHGDAAKWATMVMSFYVGMRGAQNVATILKRK